MRFFNRLNQSFYLWTFLLLISVSFVDEAFSESVSFTFGGTITNIYNGFIDPIPAPWDTVTVGDPWSITYSFESTTPDSDPSDTRAYYNNPISSYTIEIGGVVHSAAPDNSRIAVFNGLPVGFDQYEINLYDSTAGFDSLFFQLDDDTDSAWETDELPLAGDVPQPIESEFTRARDITLEFGPFLYPEGSQLTGSVDYHSYEVSEPEIEIFLDSYDFGEVQWGSTSTTAITISNTGGDTLIISEITLYDEYVVFSIDPNISTPINIESGDSIDVIINFKPEAFQSYNGLIVITSNDTDEPSIELPLSGTGVLADTPPEQIKAVIDYIQDAIEDGELTPIGPKSSAEHKLNALINMIESAGSLLENGEIVEGCAQFSAIYKKVDGITLPPDMVEGPSLPGLANAIQELMTYYECGSEL